MQTHQSVKSAQETGGHVQLRRYDCGESEGGNEVSEGMSYQGWRWSGKHARSCILRKSLTVLSITGSILLASIQPASADSWYDDWKRSNAEEHECVVAYGPIQCAQVKDAADWAQSVTVWIFGHNGHNDGTDAFRHCTWMGALATRVGERRATDIGFLHERHFPNPHSEWAMDVANNQVGASYGQLAMEARLSDQWGYVQQICGNVARNKQLYGLDGKRGNYSL